MSVRQMSLVWEHSRSECGERLVLLAIADFADDSGRAFPSVPTLAAKTRLSLRAARCAIRRLEALGELSTKAGGPGGTHVYRITITPAESAPVVSAEAESAPRQFEAVSPAESASPPGSLRHLPRQNLPPNHQEPSLNHQEPSSLSGFADFWTAYPKKKSKGDAEKAWKKQKCEPIAKLIIESVGRGRESWDWKKDGGEYIPHPATWLNRRGWEDEFQMTGTIKTNGHRTLKTDAERELERTGLPEQHIPTRLL